MRWRVYYGDGTTFSDQDGSPDEAPSLNMQVVVQHTDREGRIMICEHDYYWFDPQVGEWVGGDLFGLFDFLQRRGGHGFGRTIASDAYHTIKRRASYDPDFPRKSIHNVGREGRHP